MWTPECYFRLVELPALVPGVVCPNDDGTFEVYINSRLSEDAQAKARQHEIDHIRDEHFYCDKPVGRIEAEARGEIPCVSTEEWCYAASNLPRDPKPAHLLHKGHTAP